MIIRHKNLYFTYFTAFFTLLEFVLYLLLKTNFNILFKCIYYFFNTLTRQLNKVFSFLLYYIKIICIIINVLSSTQQTI